eukprot:scaffold147855_cov18-Tisochrysis_lutea.AAC.1
MAEGLSGTQRRLRLEQCLDGKLVIICCIGHRTALVLPKSNECSLLGHSGKQVVKQESTEKGSSINREHRLPGSGTNHEH